MAEHALSARDYAAAAVAYEQANAEAESASERWAAAVGQLRLAEAMQDRALAARAAIAASAALNDGAGADPTLLATLQMWTNAGAAVIDAPAATPTPAPLPPDEAMIESIQPNPDGSIPVRALERQRAALAPGIALFKVPQDMVEKQAADIFYRISPSRVGTFQIVPGEARPATGSHVYTIKIGRCMSAELGGAGFDITPAQTAVQTTGADRRAEWRWRVVPTQAGQRTLTLTSRILAYVAGRCTDQLELLPTQERTVEVKVARPAPASAPTPTTSPKPDDPAKGGVMGWIALATVAIGGLTALLTNLNKLAEEFGKLRDRLASLFRAKPKPTG